jgi:hypothetical protein
MSWKSIGKGCGRKWWWPALRCCLNIWVRNSRKQRNGSGQPVYGPRIEDKTCQVRSRSVCKKCFTKFGKKIRMFQMRFYKQHCRFVNLLHTNLAARHMSSHQSNFNLNNLCNTSMRDISLKEWRHLYFYNLQCLPFACYALSPFILLNIKIANECNRRSNSHYLSNESTVPTCYELAV